MASEQKWTVYVYLRGVGFTFAQIEDGQRQLWVDTLRQAMRESNQAGDRPDGFYFEYTGAAADGQPTVSVGFWSRDVVGYRMERTTLSPMDRYAKTVERVADLMEKQADSGDEWKGTDD
jgi:hypothetical protein